MNTPFFWRPSANTYRVFIGLALFSFLMVGLANLFDWTLPSLFTPGLSALTIAFIIIIFLDFNLSRHRPNLQVDRKIAGTLALNRWAPVQLHFRHSFDRAITIHVMDGLQGACVAQGAAFTVQLYPSQTTQQPYRLKPLARGVLALQACHVKIPTFLNLGELQYCLPVTSSVKVFPDYAEVMHHTLHAVENTQIQLGLKRKNRRGEGTEFHQLREYRQGDSLRQISWTATARRQHIISKEYQEERDQNVLILIDSGRRMCLRDDELTHFDHALNATLLLAYTGLRQGDNIGFLCFGHQQRWLSPQKGHEKMTVMLHALYDLNAGPSAADYLLAAQTLLRHHPKRAMVLLVTNTRDEDAEELKMAITLLRRHHLVVLANIRETDIDQSLQQPIHSWEQGLTYAGTLAYVQRRAKNHAYLLHQGVYAIDCKARDLPHTLANLYMEIKKAGVL
jgi:uncharacterized protein (DUF58 family)